MNFCKRLMSGMILSSLLAASMLSPASAAYGADGNGSASSAAQLAQSSNTVSPRAFFTEVTGNNVNLRKTPGLDGARVTLLSKGTRVMVDFTEDFVYKDGYEWAFVVTADSGTREYSGWIATKYLDMDNLG